MSHMRKSHGVSPQQDPGPHGFRNLGGRLNLLQKIALFTLFTMFASGLWEKLGSSDTGHTIQVVIYIMMGFNALHMFAETV